MDNKNIIDKYTDNLPLKLILQNIPYIGTSLDTILSDIGNKWREKRLQILLQSLNDKMMEIETANQEKISDIQKKVNTEEFYDLFIQAGQKSTMTHKKEKISRFANLLKNYLINDISTNEYLIEVFFDITEDLSESEISKLSELQIKPLEIYYSFNNKPFDIERMSNDISEQKISTDYRYHLNEYEFDSLYLFYFTRLEKLDLIQITTITDTGGYTPAGWRNQFQSTSTQIQYKRKDEIVISDFGKKYIEWVTS